MAVGYIMARGGAEPLFPLANKYVCRNGLSVQFRKGAGFAIKKLKKRIEYTKMVLILPRMEFNQISTWVKSFRWPTHLQAPPGTDMVPSVYQWSSWPNKPMFQSLVHSLAYISVRSPSLPHYSGLERVEESIPGRWLTGGQNQ